MIYFLAAFFTSLFVIAAQQAEIVIPSVVEVSPRAELSIYDVAESKNVSDELAEELKQAKIPKSRVLKNELARILRNYDAKFILPIELKIIESKSNVSRMELERKIKNKLLSNCENCDIHLRISSVPANMDSNWDIDLNIDLNKSNAMIPLFSTADSTKSGWAIVEIKKYQLVPVVIKPLKSGDVITSEMMRLEKRLVTNSQVVKEMAAIEGMQAARYLNVGQTINFSDLKKEQVLKRGQIVKAIFGSEAFEIAISAEAQESGVIGDVVKIKNLDSAKVFAAKIIDRGLVRIE